MISLDEIKDTVADVAEWSKQSQEHVRKMEEDLRKEGCYGRCPYCEAEAMDYKSGPCPTHYRGFVDDRLHKRGEKVLIIDDPMAFQLAAETFLKEVAERKKWKILYRELKVV